MFVFNFEAFTHSSQAVDNGCDLVYMASSASILVHYVIMQKSMKLVVLGHVFTPKKALTTYICLDFG
jgi:hypothetical protein